MLPKTIKIYLPGNLPQKNVSFEMPDGTVLEYDVVKNVVVPSKKNQKQIVKNRRTGRPQIISSSQFLKWQKTSSYFFENAYHKLLGQGVQLPISRCKIKCLFYFSDMRRKDLTNKWESILDELVAHQIILDDEFKVCKPLHIDGWVCKDRPRTEIYITIIPPSSPEYEWDITSDKYHSKVKERRALQSKIRYHKNKITTPSP